MKQFAIQAFEQHAALCSSIGEFRMCSGVAVQRSQEGVYAWATSYSFFYMPSTTFLETSRAHNCRKCGLVRVESTYQAYMVEVSDSCKSVLSRILYTTVNTL